ncbi:hypothetical protein [Flavobacterium polysaccharolyticum]|uniref:Bacteriocin-type signal sequence-containing protein n=1 Tax=Flavobacterium polysaccharolyticum TaxID=3133148 RepID=A0ABU9NNF4_9FLAO
MKTLDQFKKSSETIVLEKKQLNKIVGGTQVMDETAKKSINAIR